MRVGVIRGTIIRVHYLFFLLMLVFGICGQLTQAVILFACVVFHEMCHMISAVWLGYRVTELSLLPYGGVAKIEGLNGFERRECIVVLAGPLGSALFAIVCGWGWAEVSGLVRLIVETNMMLALWNLLPAYPLDGGRLCRIAFLSHMTAKTAVRRTVRISQLVAAVLFVYAGYMWLLRCEVLISVLLLVAMIVRLAKEEENSLGFVPFCAMARKGQILAREGYLPMAWYTVRGDMRAERVIELFRPQFYTMVRVVSAGGTLCGVLSESMIWQRLTTHSLKDMIEKFCMEKE